MTTVLNTNPAAQEQAAMHRAELLLARCRSCVPSRAPWAAAQSRWHEQRQAHFLAWLDAGGFAQPAPDCGEQQQTPHARRDGDLSAQSPAAATMPCPIENSGIAPLFSVP